MKRSTSVNSYDRPGLNGAYKSANARLHGWMRTTLLIGLAAAGIGQSTYAKGTNAASGIVYSKEAKEQILVGAALHRGPNRIYLYAKSADPAHRGTTVTRLFYEHEKVHAAAKLFGQDGKEVPKTRFGHAVEKPLVSQENTPFVAIFFWRDRRKFIPITLVEQEPTQFGSIDLNELFKIPESGKYRLTLALQLCKETRRDHLDPISMPSVTLDVEIEKRE